MMAKSREIISIYTERPIYGDMAIFKVGDQINGGEVIEEITRSIGGLDKISGTGPAVLGPNCPTFVVTLSKGKKLKHIAIPERTVDAVEFEEMICKKPALDDPEIQMTKE